MITETIAILHSLDTFVYSNNDILNAYTIFINIVLVFSIYQAFNHNDSISNTKTYSEVKWMYLSLFVAPFVIALFVFNSIFIALPISMVLIISLFVFRSYKNRNNPWYIAQPYVSGNENIEDAICMHCQSRIIRKGTNQHTKYWNEYSCECSKWEWVVWDHKEWTYLWPITIVEWYSYSDILYWRGYKK